MIFRQRQMIKDNFNDIYDKSSDKRQIWRLSFDLAFVVGNCYQAQITLSKSGHLVKKDGI
jgi:hypothetical protein